MVGAGVDIPEESITRSFLFLQGPHGPFFGQIADRLRKSGARVFRVGFNAGDQFFWGRRGGYIPCAVGPDEWPLELTEIVKDHKITDVVLYGEARPVHEAAIAFAKEIGLTIHIFEEGYLRPYWVTYERNGSNGHSELVDLSVTEIRARLGQNNCPLIEAPAHWGSMREHIFYGAFYHFLILVNNRKYRRLPSHRALSVGAEFRLYLKKLALMPWSWAARIRKNAQVRKGSFPYHLVLLQLAHDTNFLAHAPFRNQSDFIAQTIKAFAKSTNANHHLVFKAHPLEDGRVPTRALIISAAKQCGVANRVHYLSGGKLGPLLDHASSAVTVNSTSAQQALWRQLPLFAFGRSVYAKPEFTSAKSLVDFFSQPDAPDLDAYLDYRTFLLTTSQFAGSYYSRTGRKQLGPSITAAMLAKQSPYERDK